MRAIRYRVSSCVCLIFIVSTLWYINHHSSPREDTREVQNLFLSTNISLDGVLNEGDLEQEDFPKLYVITPTYARPEQKACLTSLSHTLLHVLNVHWIVVEDAKQKTKLVTNFLENSGLGYTHLTAATPQMYKLKKGEPHWSKPRGVIQRNTALSWIRTHLNPLRDKGVVYFADDDNTYSLDLFEEMRKTKKVGVWPVGLVGQLRYESPIVQNGKVTGWRTAVKTVRKFGLDMAGFAVNLKMYFQYPKAMFTYLVKTSGLQETTLLTALQLDLEDLEPLAANCTKVLVWHTRIETPDISNESKLPDMLRDQSAIDMEV